MSRRQAAKLRELLRRSSVEKQDQVVTLKVSWSFARALKVAATSNISAFIREAVARRLEELALDAE